MYSGNAARIYNAQPDPLERGPPKRVTRDESHIGEMVAASKKRVSWRFTLGESDREHEVVLVHSIMSYKKLVQYDGRQMHFSSTAILGDWSFSMILDGLNTVMEVRINDMESVDVPKYDFVIDRIPFRRWDVYRRKKHPITTSTYAQPNAPAGNAYGTHRWGPGGATPPSQHESQPSRGSFTGSSRGSFTGNSPPGDRSRSFSGQQEARMRTSSGQQDARTRTSSGQQDARTRSFSGQRDGQFGFSAPQQYADQHQRSSLQEQSAPFAAKPAVAKAQPPPAPVAPKPKKQPEINLIDDFGPSVSISAQSLLFDPLASAAMQPPGDSGARNVPPPQYQQQAPVMASQMQPASYVDPFAAVAAPAPLKPTTTITLDPFAPHNASNSMQRPYIQPSAATMNVGAVRAGNYQQQQPMGMQMNGMGAPGQQQTARGSFVGQQQPAVAGGMGHVNYNISQLMNPVDVNSNGQRNQPAKSINIDAFAGMGR